jgi:hypothetical protein
MKLLACELYWLNSNVYSLTNLVLLYITVWSTVHGHCSINIHRYCCGCFVLWWFNVAWRQTGGEEQKDGGE